MTASITTATITNHDEWVAFYVANVSDFAADQIGEEIVAKAQAGDFYEAEYVASQNSYIAKFEAMSDNELAAEHAANRAQHMRLIADDDFSEYDVNDYESYYAEQGLIESLQADRAAKARYTGHGPLTHNPFAGLVAVA